MAPVFVHKDTQEPVRIYLDNTINPDIKGKWVIAIQKHGGEVVNHDYKAEIVIIGKTADRIHRQTGYAASPDKRKRRIIVQYIPFLKDCLSLRAFKTPIVKPAPMGGRSGPRQKYTEEDEAHLARYFAAIVPDMTSGGRQGNRIYDNLIRLGNTNPEYKWVLRHSWQSWQNHYKHNKERINKMVELAVRSVNPERKHHWGEDRRRGKRVASLAQEEEEEESEGEDEVEEVDGDDGGDDVDDQTEPQPPGEEGRPPSRERGGGDTDQEREQSDDDILHPDGGHSSTAWEGRDDLGAMEPLDDLEQGPADPQSAPRSAERHAKFAATSSPRRTESQDDNEDRTVPSTSRRRRYSFEVTPNKRPRLHTGAPAQAPKGILRGARRPPGFKPTPDVDSNSEEDDDDDKSDSELDAPRKEGKKPTMHHGEVLTLRSTASSTVFPLSRDKTLVDSASLSHKEKGIMAMLSSASGGEVYLDEELEVFEGGTESEQVQEAIIKEDMQEKPEVPEYRTISPEILPLESNSSDDHVAAHTAQTRRRRVEQTQKTERTASYRMTRSRSRSVEPSEFLSLPLQGTSKRKGKGKTRDIDPETIEEESEPLAIPEEYLGEQDLEDLKPLETLADEEDVTKMVTNEDDFSGASNVTSIGDKSSSTSLRRRDSSESLNSDDAQTMQRIAAQHRGLGAAIKKEHRQSDALLRDFNEKRKPPASFPSNLSMARAAQILVASSIELGEPSVSTHQMTDESSDRPPTKPWKAPPTPTPVINMGQPSRMRAVSPASSSNDTAETIPVVGTRAAAYKRKIEEEEKHTPYTPPSGTRASLHLKKQNRRFRH